MFQQDDAVLSANQTALALSAEKDFAWLLAPDALMVPEAIFRANDIRGIIKKSLTPELMWLLGLGLGTMAREAGQPTMLVAQDGRLSSPSLTHALTKGLLATGIDVVDIGQVPSPVLYFATHYLATGTGVIVTGSHNAAEFNGLKMMIGGKTLSQTKIAQLYQVTAQRQFTYGQGTYQVRNLILAYIRAVVSDIYLTRPLRVVVDCGNGIAGVVAPKLLTALKCEVIPLYCEIDGHFPNHHPDPSQPQNLTDLIAAVKLHQADIGLAFDGDGDRLGVVTPNGEIIWPDRQIMLFARDVLAQNPGAHIIYDVKCSQHLGPFIQQHGGQPVMYKTGHALIKSKMQELNALFAGEMSGHFFFNDRWFGFDDALYSAARLLAMLAASKGGAEGLFAQLPNSISTPELQIAIADSRKFALIEQLRTSADFGEANIIEIDGLRVEYAKGWGLIRASNTSACLVLRFEADSQAQLLAIQHCFKQQLLALAPDLSLPF
jgi:phosphomannomutase/phosphoglucomutase